MTLTVESLTQAILSARNIEKLQADLRDAMITQLIGRTSAAVPASTTTGATNPS